MKYITRTYDDNENINEDQLELVVELITFSAVMNKQKFYTNYKSIREKEPYLLGYRFGCRLPDISICTICAP